jgi:putative ABC transport system substrate-binding protein
MELGINRRALLTVLGGALTGRARSAAAQGVIRQPTIGIVIGLANDTEMQARTRAFEQGLAARGWLIGQNIKLVYRFADNNTQRMRELASEIVALRPDCIVAHSTPVNVELKQLTQTIPVVFVSVSDPIGSGFAATMARPGGNMTGFTIHQATITSKHLSILKELVPQLRQVFALYNPGTAPLGGEFFLPSFVAAAAEFSVKPVSGEVRHATDIERVFQEAAAEPASGMMVMVDNFTTFHRSLIISLAAKFRIPTIYPYRYFVEEGGLLSLGVSGVDLLRGAADYVDRILRGASAAELPVQRPTKVELVINLKTAKALNIDVPRILLAGADTIIE